ncbi:hypothetical protein ACNVED_05110 [Legionella sp. D16C41]|uniref:hypothetical protein n=1 Tax=Legionella sp. D16C41 TaxID=3402688 RepID=UPI003AF6679B
MLTLSDYKEEVKKDWHKLQDIPQNLIPAEDSDSFKEYLEICTIAVKDCPAALQFIKPPKDNVISDDYLKVYLAALNNPLISSIYVEFLPLPDITIAKNFTVNQLKLLEKAVLISPLYILNHLGMIKRDTPLYNEYLDFFKKLIEKESSLPKESLGLFFSKKNEDFSEKEKALYIYFVQKYPLGFKNLKNETIEKIVINALGLKHFILADFTLINAVPAEFKKEAESIILEQFKDKTYLIVTPNILENELKDAYETYCNHPKRKGKCARITADYNQISVVLKLCSTLQQDIHLTFIGHTLNNSNDINNFDASKILECINLCPRIKEVILLGCKTAVLKKTEEEKNTPTSPIPQSTTSSFCLSHEKILQNASTSQQSLIRIIKNIGLTSGFVLVLAEPIKLFFINHDQVTGYTITKNQFGKIIELVNIGDIDELKLPSDKDPLCILRTKKKPLQAWQVEKIIDLTDNELSKFDRTVPELYKRNKQKYPFLRCITLRDDDIKKIDAECLLGRVVKELQAKKVRPVTIKAYVGVVYADTKELRFYSIHSGASVYAGDHNQTFWSTGKDNIDRKKLLEAENYEIKSIKQNEHADSESAECLAKCVRVEFK